MYKIHNIFKHAKYINYITDNKYNKMLKRKKSIHSNKLNIYKIY